MDEICKRLIQRDSPFELQEAIINGTSCKIFPHGPKTLQDVFLKAAAFTQREFIVNGDDRINFGHAIEQAKHFACALRQKYNLAKGSRVALLMENSPWWAVAFMALCFAGTIPVIVHADAEKSVLKAFEIANCTMIVTDLRNAGNLKSVYSIYPVIVLSNTRYPEKYLHGNDEEMAGLKYFELPDFSYGESALRQNDISMPDPDDEALISFTSGTTGIPKGVILSHRNITTGLMNMMLGASLMSYRAPKNKTDKKLSNSNMLPCSLLLSPFSHIGGYANILLMCYLGGKIVLMPKWNKDKAVDLINKEKIRSISGVQPVFVRELLRGYGVSNKIKTLQNININGIALHRDFLCEIADDFPWMTIGTGYGMTETCGSISNVSGGELINNPDTCGPVLPSADIMIVDDNGNEVPIGNHGEVHVRGAMVMQGYCYDSDQYDEICKDGWFKTGDLGYLDPDGNLHITDRIKDILLFNNRRISAGNLERLATDNEVVDEAVVIGIPSFEKCEKILLAVLTNDLYEVNEDNLKKELLSNLEEYSNNINIIFVDSLPRTSSGKINRRELRRQISSE